MLRSMTAYGRGSSKGPHGELVCELRSVNHRYLDMVVRLPEPLRALESSLRENLTAKLHRGKVEVILKQVDTGGTIASLAFNTALLDSLIEAANHVATRVDGHSMVDTVRLLQWPGVLKADGPVQDGLFDAALKTFEQAFNDFVETREREGAHIAQLLSTRVAQITQCVVELRRVRPAVVLRQREKWLAKLAELGAEHDQSRLEQELVYAAQRLDIDEELDRLDAHCAEIRSALERAEPVGRRLDFLMQECHREANTISSKANDAGTTNASVDMKVLIEQMREQVQNIE